MRRNWFAAVLLSCVVFLIGCDSIGGMGELTKALPIPGPAGSVARFGAEAAPLARGAFVDVDEPEEVELGRAVTANLGARYPLMRDRELTRYVALVGNVVAAHSERPDLRYYFAVLDTVEVNAFAAPGGFVFMTRGALGLMRDEATLAAVLGHEVAHIALRHGVETIKAEKRKRLAMLGVREGLQHASVGAFSGLIGSTADVFAEHIVLKGFSRAEEAVADRAAFRYAASAGYDPAGLRDFLSVLLERGGTDANASKFFSTHPATRERLQEQERLLQARAAGGQRNPQRFIAAVANRL